MPDQADAHWVGIWTTTPAPLEGVALRNQTLRMITRVSIGGGRVRVRLSNAHGTRKLRIGSAHIALRAEGAGIVPGSDRTLTFNGLASTTIAVGALVVSDAVELEIPPLSDLAVSVYLPDDVPEDFQIYRAWQRSSDQLHLTTWRFQLRGGDACRRDHRGVPLRQRS